MKIIKTESESLITGYVDHNGLLVADESTEYNTIFVNGYYLSDCLKDIPRKSNSRFEITIKVKVTSDE